MARIRSTSVASRARQAQARSGTLTRVEAHSNVATDACVEGTVHPHRRWSCSRRASNSAARRDSAALAAFTRTGPASARSNGRDGQARLVACFRCAMILMHRRSGIVASPAAASTSRLIDRTRAEVRKREGWPALTVAGASTGVQWSRRGPTSPTACSDSLRSSSPRTPAGAAVPRRCAPPQAGGGAPAIRAYPLHRVHAHDSAGF